jgi:iron-sulfur cluster assembly accessory protein
MIMTAARASSTTSLSALRRFLAFEVLSLQSFPATHVLLRSLEGTRPCECGYMQNRTYGLAVEGARGGVDRPNGDVGRVTSPVARLGFPRHRSLGTSIGKPAAQETPTTSSPPESLTLTPAAVEKIKELQRRRGNPNVGLRLLVSGGGCSGFQYEFEIYEGEDGSVEKNDEETVVDVDGAKLFCDGMSLSFVKGSTIDYETDMIQSKFVVSENPNAELGCGCGSSFSVAM